MEVEHIIMLSGIENVIIQTTLAVDWCLMESKKIILYHNVWNIEYYVKTILQHELLFGLFKP